MKRELKTIEVKILEESKSNGCELTVNNDVKESSYKVGVLFDFTKKGKTYRSVEFVVDRVKFGQTLDKFNAERLKDPGYLMCRNYEAVYLSKRKRTSYEDLCTTFLNNICQLPPVAEVAERLENQSLGFIIRIDENDLRRIGFWGGTLEQLERYLMYSKVLL